MAKYHITHACGHISTIQLFGKSSQRDWAISKAEQDICADCWKAEQIKADQVAAKVNAASGLPELTGTEKQILWAEKIRADTLSIIDRLPELPVHELMCRWDWHNLKDYVEDDLKAFKPANKGEAWTYAMQLPAIQSAVALLKAKTSASWWIDNRDNKLSVIFRDLLKSAPIITPAENKILEKDAQVESTVRPEQPKTETVAEISLKTDRISVNFPEKQEAFRLIMRENGYTWSGNAWERAITPFNGPAADRAIEIGHKILASGYIIRIYDASIRDNAIVGIYQPEQTNWIKSYTSGSEQGRLCIHWGRNDDYYKAAKRLPTARYVKPDISVSAEQFEEILDFAEIHQFSISENALKIIEAAKASKAAALVAHVEPLLKVKRKKPSDKPQKLDVPDNVDISDDLRDD